MNNNVNNKWSALAERQRQGLTAAFEALAALDATFLSSREGQRMRPVSFRDLVLWTKGPPGNLPAVYKMALLNDQSLRRDFDRLLARTAEWRCERAAAASSGLLDIREGNGFRLRLKPSKGAEGQVYVLIEFLAGAPDPQPLSLTVCGPEEACERIALPEFQDAVAQILCEEDSEVVRLLRNPKTEIFLW